MVSGYTAFIQRQQVRAQVWPYLILTNYDTERSLNVFNKGVGPAIVRTARVRVDGKAQPDWNHVLDALGIPKPRKYYLSTIHVAVLSPAITWRSSASTTKASIARSATPRSRA